MTLIDTQFRPPEVPTEGAPPAVALGDFMRVVSLEDRAIKMLYNSRDYIIPPHGEGIVPFEAVKLYFGDPRATNAIATNRDQFGIVSWVPDRESEIRRLRCLYDNQFGDERYIKKHPRVEVYTLNGERVLTVIDDPAGETVTPHTPSIAQNDDLMSLIQRQQATINMLMEKVGLVDDKTDSRQTVVDQSEAFDEETGDSEVEYGVGDETLPEDG